MDTYLQSALEHFSKIKEQYLEPSLTMLQGYWVVIRNPVIMKHLRKLSLQLKDHKLSISRDAIIVVAQNIVLVAQYYHNILQKSYAPSIKEVRKLLQIRKIFLSTEEIESFVTQSIQTPS